MFNLRHLRLLRSLSFAPTRLLRIIVLLAASNVAIAGTGQLDGIEPQTREFTVSVDGTKRGTCKMQIRPHKDGTIWVRSQAELRINVIVYRYNYSSTGTEIWKNGRLLALENMADFNGTQYRVKANGTEKGMQVTVDGVASPLGRDVWVNSYWHIPQWLTDQLSDRAKAKSPDVVVDRDGRPACLVSILDSDHGTQLRGKLKRVGSENLPVMGSQQPCTHYRINGDVQVDLWYDASGCLVREESQESSSHTARFDLARIIEE